VILKRQARKIYKKKKNEPPKKTHKKTHFKKERKGIEQKYTKE